LRTNRENSGGEDWTWQGPELYNNDNHKQQKYGQTSLTQLERQTLEELGYQYDRSILLRSQAMLLLKERGHDISKVLKAS
jgi:Spy/CpxP family protein refolding chaperone